MPDRDSARLVLLKAARRFSRLRLIRVDSGCRGGLLPGARDRLGWTLEVNQHAWAVARNVWVGADGVGPRRPTGFQVVPKRWAVERTFARLGWQRRLSKVFQLLPATGEAMVQVARARLMIRHPTHGP